MTEAVGEPGTGGARDAGMPPAPSHASARQRRKRPATVTILAGIQLFSALGYGISLLLLLQGGLVSVESVMRGGSPSASGGPLIELAAAVLLPLIGIFFIAALASAILLLLMRRAGWTITMLLTGLGLFAQIYLFWTGGTVVSIWLVINVLTVFYLNQRQVREGFGIGAPSVDESPKEEAP